MGHCGALGTGLLTVDVSSVEIQRKWKQQNDSFSLSMGPHIPLDCVVPEAPRGGLLPGVRAELCLVKKGICSGWAEVARSP